MVNIRSQNEIILNLIDFFKATQPDADVKPGTVIRDLMIDAPSSQIALLYAELGKTTNLQSLRLVSGSNLDKLAQNFGSIRKAATPSSGVALLTFASIPATISINSGALITASNGSTYSVQNGVSINPAQANAYQSIAVKYQNNLSFLGITDKYAVEVSVKATTAGAAGNISQYALNQTSIPGVSGVTNTYPFNGGADQENDATFRNRVLAIFSGSNIGTALGYRNLALSNSFVSDAIVIAPGDPLMIRDGTIVVKNENGTFTIISEGTGGKVDIYILGSSIAQYTDTFIYTDKSNNNDPTNSVNNFVLGQIIADVNKTITKKRIDDIAAGILPAQPVEQILEVTGSLSGANFIPATTDSFGIVSGNYELIKDTGNYSGSPWGFDTFHWTSNKVSFNEDIIRSKFNGQDTTTFSDVIDIPNVIQNIAISNENSQILLNDNSMIQLLHTPSSNVTRVFNVNTGEQYTVINQNINGSGNTNTTGVIQISGNTLPSSSDILQVDYTWIVNYDAFSDYDGKIISNNPRPAVDSIDWGISNVVRNERSLFSTNNTNTLFIGNVKHPITSVIHANMFNFTKAVVAASTVPNFTNRLMLNIAAIDSIINSIETIKLSTSSQEIYNTAENDGFIINNRVVVNSQIKYNSIIVLPTDTFAIIGDEVFITYNPIDVFNIPGFTGSSSGNQITVPVVNITNSTTQIYLDITYIAALQNALTVGIANFPISRSGNGYLLNNNVGSINEIKSNTLKRENQTIQFNVSNKPYITLSLLSTNYSLTASQIVSVIDLASGKEIWSYDFPGTITVNTNNNFVLTFTGLNSPVVGDNVLVIYFADDLVNVQPFTYNNLIYKLDLQNLLFNFTTNNFYVPIQNFILETNITFQIIDNTTGLSIGGASDGNITSVSSNAAIATFTSASFNFSNVDDLLGKSIKLINTVNVNNKGSYDIFSKTSNSTITIGLPISNLNINQINIIRVLDNKDLWTTSCTIDPVNNILILPSNVLAAQGDEVAVILFGSEVLHQSPTRLSITMTDQIVNSGIITASGTTITKVDSVVFTVINDGLKQNALSAFKTFLNLNSNSTISKNKYIVRVVSVEKVATSGTKVLKTLVTYDTLGTNLLNNTLYSNEMIENINLQNTEFILPSTANNINNLPSVGDSLKITFYYATDDDFENIYFTKNGILYTNKKFAFLDQLYVSSGFSSSQSTRFTVSFFTQPAVGTRYTAFYDYIAPKQNERILIQYNYNQAITNTTFTVENARPIDSDVLVKEAVQLFVDATLNIVVNSNSINSAAIILQNVKSAITSAINTNTLGAILNSSDLIAAAQAVSGVNRVRILAFNQDGLLGQVLTLTCQKNQYFVANTIIVNQETA